MTKIRKSSPKLPPTHVLFFFILLFSTMQQLWLGLTIQKNVFKEQVLKMHKQQQQQNEQLQMDLVQPKERMNNPNNIMMTRNKLSSMKKQSSNLHLLTTTTASTVYNSNVVISNNEKKEEGSNLSTLRFIRRETKRGTSSSSLPPFINNNQNNINAKSQRTTTSTTTKNSNSYEAIRNNSNNHNSSSSSSSSSSNDKQQQQKQKYLIFLYKSHTGQGAGNIISGLLAAHLLGIEFNRIVCVSLSYIEFHQAFHSLQYNDCYTVLTKNNNNISKSTNNKEIMTKNNTITLYNFRSPPPNECNLKQLLQSDEPIVYYSGNTYPRWPLIPNNNFFHQYYQPTQDLLNTLPWYNDNNNNKDDTSIKQKLDLIHDKSPEVVVHLRQPDGLLDARNGLDNITLHTLAHTLPNTTFLVTNRVDWYNTFKTYGWSHPSWNMVTHSALSRVTWLGGSDGNNNNIIPSMLKHSNKTSSTVEHNNKYKQNLQLWSDWYTILHAKKVYHTSSDFSSSAIHWNNVWSRVIEGTTTTTTTTTVTNNNIQKKKKNVSLILHTESWIGVETPRLVDRTDDMLRHCTTITSKNLKRKPMTSTSTKDKCRKKHNQTNNYYNNNNETRDGEEDDDCNKLNFALAMAERRKIIHPIQQTTTIVNSSDDPRMKRLHELRALRNARNKATN